MIFTMREYQPAFNPNWDNFTELLILSDAEEERGNLEAAEVLRWIARTRRMPYESATCKKGCGEYFKSYDWRSDYLDDEGEQLNARLFVFIAQPDDVDSGRHGGNPDCWKAFWSIESAYIALITACINHYDIFLNSQSPLSSRYHP